MKYCIGCVHLHFTPAYAGWSTDCTAGIDAEDASLSCRHGHWKKDLNGDDDLFNIEAAMQMAETCPDFHERTADQVDGSPK